MRLQALKLLGVVEPDLVEHVDVLDRVLLFADQVVRVDLVVVLSSRIVVGLLYVAFDLRTTKDILLIVIKITRFLPLLPTPS